jgi:hypothetical protein
MCPFGLYLPVNVLLGNLCQETMQMNSTHPNSTHFPAVPMDSNALPLYTMVPNHSPSVGGGVIEGREVGFGPGPAFAVDHDASSPVFSMELVASSTDASVPSTAGAAGAVVVYEMSMAKVAIFFSMCCLLTVMGCVAIVRVMNNPAIKRRLNKRDASLQLAIEKSSTETQLYEDEHEHELLAAGAGSIQGEALGSGDQNAALDSVYEQGMGQFELAKHIWRQLVSQLLITTATQLVICQYVSVPKRHWKSLTTILLYEYYVCSAAGMVAAMWGRTKIGSTTMLLIAVVRSAVFPLMLFYITNPTALDGLSGPF